MAQSAGLETKPVRCDRPGLCGALSLKSPAIVHVQSALQQHFVVAVWYDSHTNTISLYDPSTLSHAKISAQEFQKEFDGVAVFVANKGDARLLDYGRGERKLGASLSVDGCLILLGLLVTLHRHWRMRRARYSSG